MPKVNDTTHAWVQTQAKLSTPDEGFSLLLLFDLFEKNSEKSSSQNSFFLVGHALHTFNGADSDEKTSDDYDKVDLKT